MSDPPLPPAHACLLTPVGEGAIAVVRLTGADPRDQVFAVFRPSTGRDPFETSGQLVRGHLFDDQGDFDDVLAAAMPVRGGWEVEFHTHGSIRAVQRLLTALARLGMICDLAEDRSNFHREPGETVLDADVSEALARCRTRRAVQFVAQHAANWRRWLDAASADTSAASLDAFATELQQMIGQYARDRRLLEGVRVAILGPVNAGKSTLANRLFGRQAAVESPMAATTRDWVEEEAALAGIPLTLTDTAGLHEPRTPLDAAAIERGLRRAFLADLRWFVVDATAPADATTRLWSGRLADDADTLWILNKCDLLGAGNAICADWEGLPPERVVQLSARTGEGLETLANRLEAWAGLSAAGTGMPAIICQAQSDRVGSALARWVTDPHPALAGLVADFRRQVGIESKHGSFDNR